MKVPTFSSFFMLLFLPAGFALACITLPGALSSVPGITLETFLNGKWTPPFEKKFTEELSIYEPARTFWGTAEYRLFNDGRAGVVIGKDGWLFTAEEFQTSRKVPKIYADHLAYIKETASTLDKSGIKLIVALLPAKASVYQDELGEHRYPASKASIYKDTYAALTSEQVNVVNIDQVLTGQPDAFLKTDTHWTQAGAKLTAAAVSAEVKKACPECLTTPATFTTTKGEVAAHDGDLLRYVPVLPSIKASLMQDKIGPVSTAAESAAGDADLFGDTALPVVLVGTSYSANTLFNFAGYLKEDLGTDILNAADEGKGPFVTMQAWRETALAEGSVPPKLVIWEIPERYLTIADKQPTE